MNSILRLGAVALAAATLCGTLIAGPLDPPAAPASTPGPEPRTPISELPLIINQAGSYYLTGNLTGVDGNSGITVTADDVAIDLMGFTMQGTGGSTNGITIAGNANNVVVRNGTIRGWGDDGVNSDFGQRILLEDLSLQGNDNEGLQASVRTTVRNCRFEGNGGDGCRVEGDSVIENSTSTLNGGNGFLLSGDSIIRDCSSSANLSINIRTTFGGEVLRCTSSLGGGGITVDSDASVIECVVRSPNGGNGISFDGNCVIARNIVDDVSIEIAATPAAVRTNDQGSLIEDNVITNSLIGLLIEDVGNTIRGNTVQGNGGNYNILEGNQCELLISEIPEMINFPAHILVTGSLVPSGESGIAVCSPDVTINLGGHTLDGSNEAMGAGIFLLPDSPALIRDLVIKNGTLRGWGGGGISFPGIDGVHVENVVVQDTGARGIDLGNDAQVIGCTARSNTLTGIATGNSSLVRDCIAIGNFLDGIAVGDTSTVQSCVARMNVESGIEGGESVTVLNCASESNRFDNIPIDPEGRVPQGTLENGFGIRTQDAATIINCTARLNDRDGIATGSGSTIINCTSEGNDQDGFDIEGVITGCSASQNDSDGFDVGSGSAVTDCHADANGNNGFDATGDVHISNSQSHFNSGVGFDIGSDSHIESCTATTNTLDGILAGADSRIVNNHCQGNGNGGGVGSEIRTTGTDSHIDGNTVNENDTGITTSNTGTVVIRNFASGNTSNYSLSPTGNNGIILSLIDSGPFAAGDPFTNYEN